VAVVNAILAFLAHRTQFLYIRICKAL